MHRLDRRRRRRNQRWGLDAAPGTPTSSTLSVCRGLGNGTFSFPIDFPGGQNPDGVTVRRFNGDGRLDAVTADNNSDNLSVFRLAAGGTQCAASGPPLEWHHPR